MKPILYHLVRFRPCMIADEFANIGVVMLDTNDHTISVRLNEKWTERLNAFFGRHREGLVNSSVNLWIEEANRVSRLAIDKPEMAETIFSELTRYREGVVIMSNQRVTIKKYTDIDSLYRDEIQMKQQN